MLKKKKNSILKLHINFYFEITSRNDAAWKIGLSLLLKFMYSIFILRSSQLKWKSCGFKRSCVPPMRGIIIHGTILNTLKIQNTFYKTNSVVVVLVLAVELMIIPSFLLTLHVEHMLIENIYFDGLPLQQNNKSSPLNMINTYIMA